MPKQCFARLRRLSAFVFANPKRGADVCLSRDVEGMVGLTVDRKEPRGAATQSVAVRWPHCSLRATPMLPMLEVSSSFCPYRPYL